MVVTTGKLKLTNLETCRTSTLVSARGKTTDSHKTLTAICLDLLIRGAGSVLITINGGSASRQVNKTTMETIQKLTKTLECSWSKIRVSESSLFSGTEPLSVLRSIKFHLAATTPVCR